MKIDFHVHARERSNCAVVDEESQIRAAILAGLDGLAFTDHNRLVPHERLSQLRRKYAPFRIFTGIEVDADQEHWLVLGVHNHTLERMKWRSSELLEFAHSLGGFVILAHPFRYVPKINVDLNRCTPDGIEHHSTNTPAAREAEIVSLAARYHMALFSNSDGHRPGAVGNYFTTLPRRAENDLELVDTLHSMKLQQPPNGKALLASQPVKLSAQSAD